MIPASANSLDTSPVPQEGRRRQERECRGGHACVRMSCVATGGFHPGERADAADVLGAVGGAEAEVLVQAVADVVACGWVAEGKQATNRYKSEGGGVPQLTRCRTVEHERLLASAVEGVLEGVRDRGLAWRVVVGETSMAVRRRPGTGGAMGRWRRWRK